MIYFLDTNTCIFHLNGSAPNLSDRLEIMPLSDVKIPAIVAAELLYGAEKSVKRERNLKYFNEFLAIYEIVPFDTNAAKCYATIRADLERNGTPIGANDIAIASIALANNGIIVTNNTKEFSRVNGLVVEDWSS